MNDKIKEYYKIFKGTVIPEVSKNEILRLYDENKNNNNVYFYVDDNFDCKCLNKEEIEEIYNNLEIIDSGMFKDDEAFLEWRDNEKDVSYKEYISFRTFCIYNDVKALVYSGKSEDEVANFINEKY